MPTFRELRDKLNSLSDKQLDQEIKFTSKGYGDSYPLVVSFKNGVMKTEIRLCIAEFDLFYDTDPYCGGMPDIPYEDCDYGCDIEDSGVVMVGIDKGMPFFSLCNEDEGDEASTILTLNNL